MNIQDEVQKIHHQYGTTEKANYEIQKLFDRELKSKYSDEEVFKLIEKAIEDKWANLRYWFEQFKKK